MEAQEQKPPVLREAHTHDGVEGRLGSDRSMSEPKFRCFISMAESSSLTLSHLSFLLSK